MKRLWIGIGLLAAILAVGLWTSAHMTEVHTEIADELTEAARAAQAGAWDRAEELTREAQEDWKEGWNFSAALADHTVLDEVDGLFAQAEVYRKNRDAVAFAAVCAQLASSVRAIQEGHKLSLWNLL